MVWLAYALIDIGVLLAAGLTPKIAVLFAVSFLTKLAAVYLGALVLVVAAETQVQAVGKT